MAQGNKHVTYVIRETSQGSVLSALSLLVALNEILLQLNGVEVKAIPHSDNIVLIVSGLFQRYFYGPLITD